MKNCIKPIAGLLLGATLLTGCAQPGTGPNQATGTLLGGAAGALAGAQFGKGHGQLAAVAVGTLLGAAIGNSIGRQMDEQDKMLANQTMNQALEYAPDNKVSSWHNPNKPHSGDVVITRTQEFGNNKVCRDYVHTVIIDGQKEKVRGRACRDVRDPRAAWMVQE